MWCLTKWRHFGGAPVNDVIVTACDTSRDSKLSQSVYKGSNILWSNFHWCSVRGSWNIKGAQSVPPPLKSHIRVHSHETQSEIKLVWVHFGAWCVFYLRSHELYFTLGSISLQWNWQKWSFQTGVRLHVNTFLPEVNFLP